MAFFEIIKNYFQPLKERYFFINAIPGTNIFNFSDHLYFYLIIFLVCFVILAFKGKSLLKNYSDKGKSLIFSFLIFFWIITSLPWFITQFQWLKNDWGQLRGKTMVEKQKEAMVKVMKGLGMPEAWHDFYDFLIFAKEQIPQGSRVYVVPEDMLFLTWAHYWLYPDLLSVDSLKKAEYIISFEVILPEVVEGFEKFKEFKPQKVILKANNG